VDARVTVLGGYLGAGKTTLLNGLLDTAHGRRIAVVVNDFGSVNVDRRLVRSADEDTLELADGCVCCSLRGEVGEVMRRLAARDDLDHVVVEASGIADPAPLAAWGTFTGFAPGPTVVCADVTSLARRLRDRYVGDVVRVQLERADVLVLTRCDVADPAVAERAGVLVAEVAPLARLVRSTGGDVVAADLLDGPPPAAATAMAGPPSVPADPAHGHVSRTVTFDGPVDLALLAATLGGLPSGIVRAKGFVRDAREPARRVVVQLASRQVEVSEVGAAGGASHRRDEPGSIVVIAAGWGARESLDAAVLRLRAVGRAGLPDGAAIGIAAPSPAGPSPAGPRPAGVSVA
jgi:G3E family GTPase